MDEDINVYIHNYKCLKYRQLHEPFIDHLSILDLILNEGNNSMDVIRSGRKKNIKLIWDNFQIYWCPFFDKCFGFFV